VPGWAGLAGLELEIATALWDRRLLRSVSFQAVYNASKSFVQSFALALRDERVVSHSLSTKLQGRASRLMPDRVKAMMHRRMAEPGLGSRRHRQRRKD